MRGPCRSPGPPPAGPLQAYAHPMSERHTNYPAGTGEAPGTAGGFRPGTNGHHAGGRSVRWHLAGGNGARPPQDRSGGATGPAGMTYQQDTRLKEGQRCR